MVWFAKAKAKSIFSKLLLTDISKKQIETNESAKKQEKLIKENINSHNFLEAIKKIR